MEAIVIACFQVCWVFPVLLAFQVIKDFVLPTLVAGIIAAGLISFFHSLLVLMPMARLLGEKAWEEPVARLFARLLPAHLISCVGPCIGIVASAGGKPAGELGILLMFALHSEGVLLAFIYRLRRIVKRGDESPPQSNPR